MQTIEGQVDLKYLKKMASEIEDQLKTIKKRSSRAGASMSDRFYVEKLLRRRTKIKNAIEREEKNLEENSRQTKTFEKEM